jgi:hypothetical protein
MARKIIPPPSLPPYVAPTNGLSHLRVTITAELPKVSKYGSTVFFLGEYDGEAVAVEVYQMREIVALRRALADHGAARFDTLEYRMDLATPEQVAAVQPTADPGEAPIPLSEEERRALLALAFMKGAGIIRPADPRA